ncbi:pleckstrin homology domain-containing family F member 2-like [Astatotilapia calliptera]|uniref:Pleckstrin homology and FYVE domain containing 1 n=1 Tax=Astatotilapia calliptera TaxID=8154 RepID=A0A3P8QCN2_ASTCA|nr:pleckstrin homology domain-containing family F member 2-like [Astatotilapia calliptera]
MMDHPTFERENQERVQAVESSFHQAGKPLSKPGRILIGEGTVFKQGRKKIQQKILFLFTDILVYGSIVVPGRWYKKQKIIPLEDIELEDLEDSDIFKHQWLIRTPSKSFFVSAPSYEEKKAWIEHINECLSSLMQGTSCKPSKKFAVSWIPDPAACKCMRCLSTKFGGVNRRHHCRNCGFLVCNSCSKQRAVIDHIHPTKKLRICSFCYKNINEEKFRDRGDSAGKSSSEEEEFCPSGEENEKVEEGEIGIYSPSNWLDTKNGTWERLRIYDYPKSIPSQ